ncbi:chorismate synthase [Micromonospora sp. TSRI0369]|uniref:mycothiol transferase n=1 Tax=Micromonospora sp. TSRI0369 TaxID=1703936 RepID=UPI00093CFE99|nr:DinB family protein [Micromonospora sp. TSRI0369]OKJ46351.1 chorismate synthase [Micromonospora sp. TSRI0369]
MDATDVLIEAYGRLPDMVAGALDGLDAAQLRRAPAEGANPVGWLVWHLTRIQDDHVADVMGEPQLWAGGDWAARCSLRPDPAETGFGHGPEQIAAVRPESGGVLLDYHRAVVDRSLGYLRGLRPADLDRVVDENWDPPVTLGVRLVSVLDDDFQHVGQAAYVRGLILG